MRESYTKDFIQTIIDLYNSGKSVTDLSVEYGVKKVTIYSLIKTISPNLFNQFFYALFFNFTIAGFSF